ncbi:MAG TPA: DUF2339 domain-containing protein, partial [Kaistiaceae bacterium]|nr:DUF2339 domain-containing protein [Kaistiaceae bacterium]
MDWDALILLLLAIPVAAVVGFILAIRNHYRLRRMEARLAALETALAAAPGAAALPQRPATDEAPAVPPEVKAAAAPPPLPPEAIRRAEAGPVPARAAAPETIAAKSADIEETIGSRLTVWIGGIALALGGVFLVRYAIEKDLVTPAMRIALGGLFSLVLLGLGEWLRRNERRFDLPALPQADIPAVLTAAGTVAAFATVYAAYALYEFIGPAIAFVALGAIAVATMALSALHAPWLAGIGLVGAYATPALVSTGKPEAWALFAYLGFVTLAAFWLARARHWRWLAIASGVAAIAWGIVYATSVTASTIEMVPTTLYVVALGLLVVVFLVRDVHPGAVPDVETPNDWLATGFAGGLVFLAFVAMANDDFGPMSLVLALALA